MILRGLGYGGSLASAGFGAWATIGGSGVTVYPGTLTATVTVLSPSLSLGSTVSPLLITAEGTVLSPSVSLSSNIQPSVLTAEGHTLAPIVEIGILVPVVQVVGDTYTPTILTDFSNTIQVPVAGHVLGRVLPILSPGYLLYIKSQKRLWYDRHTNTLHYVLSDGKTILLQD
jgi:hypothetical protein